MGEGMGFSCSGDFGNDDFDFDYEFDVVRYFDFTRPESMEDAAMAESWFQYAGSYPPSPLTIKLNDKDDIAAKNTSSSLNCKDNVTVYLSENKSNSCMDPPGSAVNGIAKDDVLKNRSNSRISTFQSRMSTLMKPTASMLAKQNQQCQTNSTTFQKRFQKPLSEISEGNSKNSITVDNQKVKRQKLENGYLRKVALLKHQSIFVHKTHRKPGHLDHARLRVTIPKEPELETGFRAHRHRRVRNDLNSSECTKLIARPFKACSLNNKAPKKMILQLPEFQDNKSTYDLTDEFCNKLSLTSKIKTSTDSLPKCLMPAKGSKENLPRALHHGTTIRNSNNEKSPKNDGKMQHGVDCRMINNVSRHNITRSMGIR